MKSRYAVLLLATVAVMSTSMAMGGDRPAGTETYDVVLKGGTVIDGTGKPGYVANVGIRGDRIAAIGPIAAKGRQTIDARGLVIAPGFIDMHNHSDMVRLANGRGPSYSLQGVTTEVFGEDMSMGPLGGKRQPPALPPGIKPDWKTLGEFLDRLERQGSAANFCSFVGSGAIRAVAVGYDNRAATPAEIEEEKKLVREAMAEGAMGLSSGLSYAPNIYMSTEELTTLAKEAGAVGGIYASHVRTINGYDPNAIREAIQIGEGAGVPVHLFHWNSVASTSAPEFLKIIHEAQQRGVRVTGDAYPYTWGITWLASYLPTWAQAGGTEAMLARLRDPEQRKLIAHGFQNDPPFYARIGWENVRVGVDDPLINGKLVTEVAAMRHVSADDAYMDVVLEQHGQGIVIDKNNEEDTLLQVIREPYVAVGTDGWAVDLDDKNGFMAQLPHPRMMATFTKWLARYVREQHLMSREEAVRRMTSLPASILGLADRGVLAEGKAADIVVFDPEKIMDRATFPDPKHYSEGILYLYVNGQAVVREGKITGALPGRALRGRGYHATAAN